MFCVRPLYFVNLLGFAVDLMVAACLFCVPVLGLLLVWCLFAVFGLVGSVVWFCVFVGAM